jgi:Mg2+-importing ATPase
MRLASPPESRTEHGLTAAEAARQLAEFGPNLIETGSRFRLLRTGLGLLANPLVVILLVASIVSGVVGETLSAAIIVSIVLLSVALDFFQSFRSEKAASSLQSLVTLTASVWRDGPLAEVPVRDVVPGDLLQLRAGDLVPGDAT